MTLGIDVLLLSVDPGLRVVRDRESTGYAMRAAYLIELAVARRVGVRGGWVRWLHVLDAQPTGEPLLDASLASLAASSKQLPADWICEQAGVVNEGLALLEAQGAVRLYSRRLTSRLTLTEPMLLDPARQGRIRSRLDRFVAAGSAADVLDWALAGLVYEGNLWIPGHYDRAAWRRYKEAARGERGRSGTDHVEATIRDLVRATRTAMNRER